MEIKLSTNAELNDVGPRTSIEASVLKGIPVGDLVSE